MKEREISEKEEAQFNYEYFFLEGKKYIVLI